MNYNYCRKHSALKGVMPAVDHGLALEVWSVQQMIETVTTGLKMSTVAKQALLDFFIAVAVCALIVGITLAIAGVYEPTAAKPKDEPGPYSQPSRTATVVSYFVGGCIIGGMLGAFPGAIIAWRRLSEDHFTNT